MLHAHATESYGQEDLVTDAAHAWRAIACGQTTMRQPSTGTAAAAYPGQSECIVVSVWRLTQAARRDTAYLCM